MSVCVGDDDRGLAEEVRLQVTPPKDILRHAEDRINRLDPFVPEEGEPCDAKQSVERIHLQEGGSLNKNRYKYRKKLHVLLYYLGL